jgi:hypothetical protein
MIKNKYNLKLILKIIKYGILISLELLFILLNRFYIFDIFIFLINNIFFFFRVLSDGEDSCI